MWFTEFPVDSLLLYPLLFALQAMQLYVGASVFGGVDDIPNRVTSCVVASFRRRYPLRLMAIEIFATLTLSLKRLARSKSFEKRVSISGDITIKIRDTFLHRLRRPFD